MSEQITPPSPYIVLAPALPPPAAPKEEVKPRFCLYARKSSEDDERQAMSIDSQIKEMLAIAQRDSLDIAEVRQESHSAKQSSSRPVFNQLLTDVKTHLFTGILTWAPDRLSRNAGDLGTLVDLMDQGHLLEIRTHSQKFTCNPNDKFLLMILCSQAKLENDNRGINVKRGQRARAATGYRPCMSPLGYLTERRAGERKSRIIIDPVRGPLVRQMFDLVAERGMSIRSLFFWARDIANFRTRKGKTISMSIIQRLIHNPYYTGSFEYPQGSGDWVKGEYEALVSKELFDEVQKLISLGRNRTAGWGYREYRFVRFMHCGACGSGVTPQEKRKVLLDGSVRRYVYYYCTKSRDPECKESAIREENLIEQLIFVLDQIDLDAIGLTQRLESEMLRFERFAKGVLGISLAERRTAQKIDAKAYALYLLTEGTAEEKRELLACLRNRILLQGGHIRLTPLHDVEVAFSTPSPAATPLYSGSDVF
ncbi:MAG: recombinase family protein [Candidatus Peribacteraceae bacterium]|nr:recombinase family protein [Candidatus Peribacteraceae bacterium]MDD5742760.1 recombinase family protein [Candidatus Peribacteraceae bacterium]